MLYRNSPLSFSQFELVSAGICMLGFLAMFSPSEKMSFAFSFAGAALLLLWQITTTLTSFTAPKHTLALYLFIAWCVANQLVRATEAGASDLGFFLYWITFGSSIVWILCLYLVSRPVLRILFAVLRAFLNLQMVLILIQGYRYGKGDDCTGTFPNAHFAGFSLYFLLFVEITETTVHNRLRQLGKLSLLLYAAWLTDANTFLAAFVTSYATISVLYYGLNIGILIGTLAVVSVAVQYFLVNYGGLLLAFAFEAPKIRGYLTLIDIFKDNWLNLLFGLGAGQYSSRASVILAPPTLIAKPQGSAVPVTDFSDHFAKFLAPLFSPEYYAIVISRGNTGTFYTPFSEMLSLISETGIIGTILFLAALHMNSTRAPRGDKKSKFFNAVIFMTTILMICYDNWLEYPAIALAIAFGFQYTSITRNEK